MSGVYRVWFLPTMADFERRLGELAEGGTRA